MARKARGVNICAFAEVWRFPSQKAAKEYLVRKLIKGIEDMVDKYDVWESLDNRAPETIAIAVDFLTGTGERIANENLLCERKRKVKVYIRKGKS